MRHIVYEGVAFVVEACREMGRERFIEAHLNSFWPERDEETRRKMLKGAWSKISKSK